MKKSPSPLLKQERQRLGWTQQHLADQLKVTKITVGRWERGEMVPQAYHRKHLCALLQKNEHDLFPSSLPSPIRTPDPPIPTVALLPPDPPIPLLSFPSPQSLLLTDPMIPVISASQPLIGRERDLAWIKHCLTAGENVALTALNGLPGVGKTALATAIASDKEIRAHFSDGILWAALGPTPDVVGILSRWGRLLHMPEHHLASLLATSTIADWAAAIRTAIGTRSLFLVIDDAWQVEEALAFRVGGPTCAHLLTTRFPQIAAQMTIRNTATIEELSEAQSMHLLQALAPQVVAREPEKVRAIAQAVGGLPLALMLVGNYLRTHTYGATARRIEKALDAVQQVETRLHLSEPHIMAQAHPSLASHSPLSLQTILAVTDERLSHTARHTLYALSVFPAKPTTFSEEAALAVTGASLQDLDELVDAGFLEYSHDGRYRLHQIIADYAQVHCATLPDCTALADQLCAYILSYLQRYQEDYEHLEQEYPIILATLERAFHRPVHAITIQLVCACAPALMVRGLYTLAEQYLTKALTLTEAPIDPDTRITLLLYLGKVSIRLCKDEIAHRYYQEGLQLAHRSQSPSICDLLSNLGAMSWKLGELTQAQTYLQESLSIAHKRNDARRMGECYKHLGNLFAYRGDYTGSKDAYRQALEIAHYLNDRMLFCVILGNLGTAVGEEGDTQQAHAHFHHSLEVAHQIGFQEQICVSLLNLGNTTFLLGDPSQAEQQLQDGLTRAREMKHTELVTSILYELSVLAGKRQEYEQSAQYIHECLQLTQQINRPQSLCLALYQHGNLALQHNDVSLAEQYYQRMLQAVPPGQQSLLAIATYGLAQIAARKGSLEEARIYGEQSIHSLKNRGDSLKQEIVDWFTHTVINATREDAGDTPS